MAAAALVLIVVIGLIRGEDFDQLFLVGISLAIAAIPTGLPAVVTTLLSFGTQELAKKGAIVKRLRSVETLGSTSAICSDKTGTLTLNQMTARELVVVGGRYSIDGEGYSTVGRILRVAGTHEGSLEPFVLPMALANDAVIRDGACIGDPTEGALVVLAAKGGIDVDETRRYYPRIAEVPFDAEYKLMATFHEMDDDGSTVVRCFVKGAPDVLLARSTRYMATDGSSAPMANEHRERVLSENDRLAGEGLRVLAVARRDFDPGSFDPAGDLLALVADLELVALIGIVDPPRKEAKDAIALCHDAGIRVRMITGDHATTASAIAQQLGIEGRALTGAEFAAMPDEQLLAEVDGIGVVARVAPEDKVRLVSILKQQGNIVAMTGDGVNDAPSADPRRHRRRHGHHRHRGHQGRGRDDPHRRQLRHDRGRGRGWARSLRQPDEVHPGPDDHAGRLHPHLRRRRHLRHRQRLAASPTADPVDQFRRRRASRPRPRIRRAVAGTHEPTSSITERARDRAGPRRSTGFRRVCWWRSEPWSSWRGPRTVTASRSRPPWV